MDGDTEVIRNLLVPMGSAFNPCESGEATLLKLSAGVVGRLPTGHVASLSTQIFAAINKSASEKCAGAGLPRSIIRARQRSEVGRSRRKLRTQTI